MTKIHYTKFSRIQGVENEVLARKIKDSMEKTEYSIMIDSIRDEISLARKISKIFTEYSIMISTNFFHRVAKIQLLGQKLLY